MTGFRKLLTRRELGMLAGVLAVLLVVLQFLPIGAERTNPPVVEEPRWDSPATRTLFFRACADCHSNETRWPWYSRVAPASWLVANDVKAGRRHLNVSEWNRRQRHADDAAGEVREGKMPLAIYLPMHAEARLSAVEKQQLIAGLVATMGDKKDGNEERGKGSERDD